jgi:SAM-dependent methyltransferase
MTSSDRYTGTDHLRDHPSWHREDSTWKAAQIVRMLDRHGLRPVSLLDVGCGRGAVLAALAPRLPGARRLLGCDVSAHPIAMGAGGHDPRIELRQGEPPDDETFDLLLCIDVLEHVEDYIGFLRGLRGTATHMVLHIPLDASAQSVLRAEPLLDLRRRSGHLHYFTRDTALATLETAGYELIDGFYTRGSLERPPQSALSMLARWPRRALFGMDPDLAARMLGGFSLMVLVR